MEKVKDAAVLAQHLPVLHKVTSADGAPATSGHHYLQLAALTFHSDAAADRTAELLCQRLRASPAGSPARARTLTAVLRVAEAASRRFRGRLRELDEHLRAAEAAGGGGERGADGKVEREARQLARDIRVYLFSDEVLAGDARSEPEVPPDGLPRMGGMGVSSVDASAAEGKLSGFGSAPIDKSNLADSVMGFLERTLSPTNEKEEVLSMCLRAPSTGDYQPVDVGDLLSVSSPAPSAAGAKGKPAKKQREHVKGRAGGGWESDDGDGEEAAEAAEEKAEREKEELRQALASLEVEQEEVEEATDALLADSCGGATADRATDPLRKYCSVDSFPTLAEVEAAYAQTQDLGQVAVLALLAAELKQSAAANSTLRALLLAEELLMRPPGEEGAGADVFRTALAPELTRCRGSEDPRVAVKARKVELLIECKAAKAASADKS